ncbi:MAG: cell division protein SepF [Chthonomonas sp.]|nr:cell division protein SepF [Chthonomonas sp.]
MEERAYVIDEEEERTGFFSKFSSFFNRGSVVEDIEENDVPHTAPRLRITEAPQYTVVVRRQVVSFNDAVAAADGLKQGRQQILNLCAADAPTREKIKDFMAGVNYAQEGHWEEVGENIYLLAPRFAQVDCVPATPRMQAKLN